MWYYTSALSCRVDASDDVYIGAEVAYWEVHLEYFQRYALCLAAGIEAEFEKSLELSFNFI